MIDNVLRRIEVGSVKNTLKGKRYQRRRIERKREIR
jgi:hypothetical protein